MPIISPEQSYKLIAADGTVILKGGFSQLMEVIPQSVARLDAEQAILAAKAARAPEDRLDARADSLDQREAKVRAREDALRADDLRRFVNGVSALTARMEALEAERNQRALDALPDPDNPQDDLEAVLEPSADRHREMLEAQEAIEKDEALELRHEEPDDGDPAQALPSALEPTVGRFEGNRLPEGTVFPVKSDGFVCGRDRKAARRRMRANGE